MRLSWLRGLLRPTSRRATQRSRLVVEALEERVVPEASVMQVRDINPRTNSALPSDLLDFNGILYFAADDGLTGRELWRSDGTAAGTFQVANLADDSGGTFGSNPNGFLAAGGAFYFFADDMQSGPQLWRSNGADVFPVSDALIDPSELTNVNGTLYFVDNGRDLYRSNGTSDGTQLIQSFNAAGGLAAVGSRLYFSGETAAAGAELYEYDGTTLRLIDIVPGSGGSGPDSLTNVNGTLYFTATTPEAGPELYQLNAGTPVLIELLAGTDGSSPSNLTNVNGVLFFRATAMEGGAELYRYDGTTLTLIDIVPGEDSSSPNNLTNVAGTLYLTATTPATGTELYRYSGTTLTLIDIVTGPGGSNPGRPVLVGGMLYVTATTPATGSELFRVTGTTAVPVLDAVPGPASAFPGELTGSGSRLFFTAISAINGVELWVSDGTAGGTFQVKEINEVGPGSNPANLTRLGSVLYFTANDGVNGAELWRSDGTATTLIDIVPGPSGSNPADLTVVNGTLYLTAATPAGDRELYRLDGTTPTLIDVDPGPGSSNPGSLTAVNGTLYFTATTPASGRELFRLDGTTPTPLEVVAGNTGSNPVQLTNVAGTLYFVATTDAAGTELYQLNGSTPTLIDVLSGTASSNPTSLTAVGGTLYFAATTPGAGAELYRLNGTTPTLFDLIAGPGGSNPRELTAVNGTLYFVAIRSGSGDEVWTSNGTPGGTVPVTTTLLNPTRLTASGGLLYFVDDGSRDLYRTNGTAPGTIRLLNDFPIVNQLTDVNGTLLFAADDGLNGEELWQSDGSIGGTRLLADVFPGPDPSGLPFASQPAGMTAVNGTVFFAAEDLRGRELWKATLMAPQATVQFSTAALSISENGDTATVTVTRTGSTTAAASVVFATSNGTAGSGDYTATTGTLNFAIGQSSQTFTVGIVNDPNPEPNETINLTLSAPSGVVLGNPSTAVLTIVDDDTLRVTSFTPTPTGFVAEFNRAIDPAVLNLYDTQAAALGLADVTLTGSSTGAVRGSLVIDQTNTRVTFIRTGGVLPVDSYTVTLRSAANAFKEPSGNLLDGDGNGTSGGDYTNSFPVASSTDVVVSAPDFARGPGQPVAVPASLPLRLSASLGVTSVSLRLRYDPALLSITNATIAPGISGAMVTLDTTTTPGVAIINFTASPGLSAGVSEFVRLTAAVPEAAAARYLDKQVLDLFNVTVNGAAAMDDDGVHVNAYFADATGNGTLSSADAARIQRVALGFDSGFDAYRLADPRLVVDINGNGRIDSTDVTWTLQKVVGLPRPQIPDRPAGIVIPTPPGPDPLLYLPKRFAGRPGQTVTVPVLLDHSAGLEAIDLALSYDGQRLEFVEAQRGRLTDDFELLLVNTDAEAGTLRLALSRSAGPIDDRGPGGVVLLTFRIRDDAPAGRAIINLRESLDGTTTALNEGGLDLNPDPTDQAGDVLDGMIAVLHPRRLADVVRDLVFAAVPEPSRASDVVRAFLAGRRGNLGSR